MVKPLVITNEMKESKEKEKDKIMTQINKKISEAIKLGWHETSFDCYDDSLYDEIKKEYIEAGYKIYPNIYARCGGRNDFIAW